MLIAVGGMVWATGSRVDSADAAAILGPLVVTALGVGLVIAPAVNTGTYGVAPYDAGVASATISVGQQLGGSIGTALLNTLVASATASYLASRLNPRTVVAGHPSPALVQQSLVHGYIVGFWWTAAIFAGRRRGVRDAAAARAAVPAAGTRRGCAHGRGTGGGTGANRRPPGGMIG